MLDGWRGLAALSVVCFHIFKWPGGNQSVILFFVISGYCVTAAGSSAFRRDLGFRQFMWRRVKRIYPPYLLSLAYFAAIHVARQLQGKGPQFAKYHWTDWLQNLTLTQWVSLLRHPLPLAPANSVNMVPAYWSLGYEEQFYLVTAGLIALALIFEAGPAIVVAALALAGLTWNLVSPHWVYGFFIEYWVHFTIGALVFWRLCRFRHAALRHGLDGALVALAIAGLVRVLGGADAGAERSIGMEWLVAASFGLLLILVRRFDGYFRFATVGKVLGALGLISYSLYLTHQCSELYCWRIASALWPSDKVPLHTFHFVNGMLQIGCHLVFASIFWYACERPFLNRPLAQVRPELVLPDTLAAAV